MQLFVLFGMNENVEMGRLVRQKLWADKGLKFVLELFDENARTRAWIVEALLGGIGHQHLREFHVNLVVEFAHEFVRKDDIFEQKNTFDICVRNLSIRFAAQCEEEAHQPIECLREQIQLEDLVLVELLSPAHTFAQAFHVAVDVVVDEILGKLKTKIE